MALASPPGPGRDAILSELKAQARLLAEKQRLMLNNEAWRSIDLAVSIILRVL